MLRSKRKNKGRYKNVEYKNVVHYGRLNSTITQLLDNDYTEVFGGDIVDLLSDLPDPTLNDKRVIRCLGYGLGGTTFISINNRWRCFYGSTYLKHETNQYTLPSPKNTKQIIRQIILPRIGSKSVMQPGDTLRVFNVAKKTGSNDIFNRSFFFGNTGVISTDVEIDLTPAINNTIQSQSEIAEFIRMADSGGNSVIMKNYNKNTTVGTLGGPSTTSLAGDSITIPNMDTNDTFFSLAYVLNNVSDNLIHYNWNVELLSSGP